jgi:NAD-dependent dihydropyrimidine dehydrogenase PreA subunit
MTEADAYTRLADKLGFKDSPYFRGVLEALMNPTQAELAATLPGDPAEIAPRLGVTTAEVEEMTEDMYQRGILFPTSKGWFFSRDVMQLHDSTQGDPRYDDFYGDRLFKAWDAFCDNEWYGVLAREGGKQSRPMIRVVPHWGSIKDKPGVLPSENIPEILKRATAIAVVPCPCRRQIQACTREVVTCMQAEGAARYAIKRGTGRELSYEEALQVVEEIEREGLIHQLGNISYETKMPSVLCNCCSDCCVALKPYIEHGVLEKTWAKSRWEAEVDPDLCDGCQECIDRCNYDAIDMVRSSAAKRLAALVDPERCWGCGACVTGCPQEAIDMKVVRPAEHIPVGL